MHLLFLRRLLRGLILTPNVSIRVTINDSLLLYNKNGYFKDDIDLGQLRSNIKKLMDEDKVLELNTNNVTDGVVDTMNSTPNLKNVSTNTKSVLAEAKGSENGSLWEQFSMTHAVSMSQPKSSMSYTDESDKDKVYMPDVLPGGGFLEDMEGDLDCYNGYEAQVYDIAEKEQAFVISMISA
ncbi:hypothetical protein Tco_0276777 [Tanacetum coccineum]